MIHCFITCNFIGYINTYDIHYSVSHSPSVWHWVWPTERIISLLLFSWRVITYIPRMNIRKTIFFLLSVGLPSFASVVVWLVFPCWKQDVAQHYTLQRSLLWLFLIFTLAQARQHLALNFNRKRRTIKNMGVGFYFTKCTETGKWQGRTECCNNIEMT